MCSQFIHGRPSTGSRPGGGGLPGSGELVDLEHFEFDGAARNVDVDLVAYLASLLEDIFTANAEHLPYRELQLKSALWVAYRLAELLPLPAATKVAVLQADDGLAALSRLDAGIQAASSPAPKGTH